MGMRRRLFTAALVALITMGSVSVASANVATAPGRAVTFYRGVTTIVTTWSEVISTETESRLQSQVGACESQTRYQNEERIKTTTRYYTRTLLHRGTANSNGALISDTTVYEDVVSYSAWVAVGDPYTVGSCGQGNPVGNSGNGQGNGGGNGTGNEGIGNGKGHK